jgi:hypothetical protein
MKQFECCWMHVHEEGELHKNLEVTNFISHYAILTATLHEDLHEFSAFVSSVTHQICVRMKNVSCKSCRGN